MATPTDAEAAVRPASPPRDGAAGSSQASAPAPTREASPPTAPIAPSRPGGNGVVQPEGALPTEPAVPPASRRGAGRRVRLLVLGVLAILALGAGTTVGYRWWYDSVHFVSTDNAQIVGSLIQVGALSAGRVSTVRFDIGDQVRQNDVVATLHVPVPTSQTSNGNPRMEFTETENSLIEARAPLSGVVVARGGNPGDTVPAGQPLLTIADPNRLWVNANIEETQVRRLQVGQAVTIHVDVLDADLDGRVAAITPASAATFSLLPQQNLSGNYTKVTQLVPVKILFNQPDPRLAIGTSVEVKIRVAD